MVNDVPPTGRHFTKKKAPKEPSSKQGVLSQGLYQGQTAGFAMREKPLVSPEVSLAEIIGQSRISRNLESLRRENGVWGDSSSVGQHYLSEENYSDRLSRDLEALRLENGTAFGGYCEKSAPISPRKSLSGVASQVRLSRALERLREKLPKMKPRPVKPIGQDSVLKASPPIKNPDIPKEPSSEKTPPMIFKKSPWQRFNEGYGEEIPFDLQRNQYLQGIYSPLVAPVTETSSEDQKREAFSKARTIFYFEPQTKSFKALQAPPVGKSAFPEPSSVGVKQTTTPQISTKTLLEQKMGKGSFKVQPNDTSFMFSKTHHDKNDALHVKIEDGPLLAKAFDSDSPTQKNKSFSGKIAPLAPSLEEKDELRRRRLSENIEDVVKEVAKTKSADQLRSILELKNKVSASQATKNRDQGKTDSNIKEKTSVSSASQGEARSPSLTVKPSLKIVSPDKKASKDSSSPSDASPEKQNVLGNSSTKAVKADISTKTADIPSKKELTVGKSVTSDGSSLKGSKDVASSKPADISLSKKFTIGKPTASEGSSPKASKDAASFKSAAISPNKKFTIGKPTASDASFPKGFRDAASFKSAAISPNKKFAIGKPTASANSSPKDSKIAAPSKPVETPSAKKFTMVKPTSPGKSSKDVISSKPVDASSKKSPPAIGEARKTAESQKKETSISLQELRAALSPQASKAPKADVKQGAIQRPKPLTVPFPKGDVKNTSQKKDIGQAKAGVSSQTKSKAPPVKSAASSSKKKVLSSAPESSQGSPKAPHYVKMKMPSTGDSKRQTFTNRESPSSSKVSPREVHDNLREQYKKEASQRQIDEKLSEESSEGNPLFGPHARPRSSSRDVGGRRGRRTIRGGEHSYRVPSSAPVEQASGVNTLGPQDRMNDAQKRSAGKDPRKPITGAASSSDNARSRGERMRQKMGGTADEAASPENISITSFMSFTSFVQLMGAISLVFIFILIGLHAVYVAGY